jgi:hypothetical protein
MRAIKVSAADRGSVRRSVKVECQAVALNGFRLLGERIVDLSEHGALVACDRDVRVGEKVVVSFRAPQSERWIDVEGEVARIVEGWRPEDPGFAFGLRFDAIDPGSKRVLKWSLFGIPPAAPRRGLRRGWTLIED